MTAKPAFPTNPFEPWPYMPVDQTAGSDFQHLRRAAVLAADGLMLSDVRPSPTAPRAQRTAAAVEEALLYLLEMGLIDVDEERLTAYLETPHPFCREGR